MCFSKINQIQTNLHSLFKNAFTIFACKLNSLNKNNNEIQKNTPKIKWRIIDGEQTIRNRSTKTEGIRRRN